MPTPKTKYARKLSTIMRDARTKHATPYTHIQRELRLRGMTIPPQSLKRIEEGSRKVSVDEAYAILDILGHDPKEFFNG